MKQSLTATILILPVLCNAAGLAVSFNCPQRITTKQSLHEPVAGWRESQERPFTSSRLNDSGYSEHNLDFVDFSVGPPEDRGTLAPDHESQPIKGQWTSTWKLQNSKEVWFSCWYRGTKVILSKQLPAEFKSCSVKYNRNRGIIVEQVSCE